jgi:pimeloyl-ACP methyl ester carboxylesterase
MTPISCPPDIAMAPEIFVMLHSGGSSSRQWNDLAGRIAARGALTAQPSLVGHDGLPAWGGSAPSLAGEVERVCAQIPPASAVHLVGHSYGGAVAVKAALSGRLPVRSLAVYEPSLFPLLDGLEHLYDRDTSPRHVGEDMIGLVREGRAEAAARLYIDYWNSGPTFDALPADRRARFIERMPVVKGCFEAIFADTPGVREMNRLAIPCLVMSGNRSPQPSQDISELVAAGAGNGWHHRFAKLNHMGPLAAPEAVNNVIEDFLVNIEALTSPARRPPAAFRPVASA